MDSTTNRLRRATMAAHPPEALPLTPAISRALGPHLAARARFICVIYRGTAAAIIALAVAVAALAPRTIAVDLAMVVVGGLLIWYAQVVNRRALAGVRSGIFYRAAGTPTIEGDEVLTVRIGAGAMRCSREVRRAIEDVPYAVADYTQRGGEVIEIRDATGAVLYRMPGYTP